MPTPESAEAFKKLVEARDRLTEVTQRLNKAYSGTDGVTGTRYRDLQAEWDTAFREFEAATLAFSMTVKQLREDMDIRQKGESPRI
jgi:curved DNA-binding protein CbpA